MSNIFKILFGVVFVGVIAFGIYLYTSIERDHGVGVSVTSFEECAAAGYPILDSNPPECETPDGRTFTKTVEEVPPTVTEHIESKRDLIVLSDPKPLSRVTSPLSLSGEARGTWYFEASFSVRIEDANGNVLGEHYATAQGEWMTENFVPFESTFEFDTPTTETGTLILEKSNPSGLAENANELRIPIRFASENVAQRTVELYYYNPSLDEDASGNILCSDAGLVAVLRTIPVTQTPIQDTIHLLLRGELTSAEEAQGITTEFPLEGVTLEGASLERGVLTLEFSDPNSSTSGGSCRSGILWQQIRETAEQFTVVEEVRFQPEELFQP